MDYSAWLDLVVKAGASVTNVDPAWLQSQHGSSVSPAVATQQINAGVAPVLPPVLAQQAKVWQCKGCGGKEFFYEPVQIPHKYSPVIIGVVFILCLVTCGILIPFLLVAHVLSAKFHIEQKPRCRRCGLI
jgi:hypothetical protein